MSGTDCAQSQLVLKGKWHHTKIPFNVVGEVFGVIQKQHQSSLRVIQGQEADGDFVWATEL